MAVDVPATMTAMGFDAPGGPEVFRPETLRAGAARAEDAYAGVRIDFVAELAGARLPMHADIGYGDAITPGAIEIE